MQCCQSPEAHHTPPTCPGTAPRVRHAGPRTEPRYWRRASPGPPPPAPPRPAAATASSASPRPRTRRPRRRSRACWRRHCLHSYSRNLQSYKIDIISSLLYLPRSQLDWPTAAPDSGAIALNLLLLLDQISVSFSLSLSLCTRAYLTRELQQLF